MILIPCTCWCPAISTLVDNMLINRCSEQLKRVIDQDIIMNSLDMTTSCYQQLAYPNAKQIANCQAVALHGDTKGVGRKMRRALHVCAEILAHSLRQVSAAQLMPYP